MSDDAVAKDVLEDFDMGELTREGYLELQYRMNPNPMTRIMTDLCKEMVNPGGLDRQHNYSKYSPFVYFIQVGTDGPIKIGTSGNPRKRMAQLQTAHAEWLRIVLMFPGDRKTESYLHEKLDNLCLGGEWYAPRPALIQFIRLLKERIYGSKEDREAEQREDAEL